MTDEDPQTAEPKPPILRRIWRFGARLDVAAVLILAMLLLAVLGSCFPQLSSPVAADPERLAQWETGVRARYGALTDLLSADGAFRCFRSPAFLISLALLVVATLVCTLNRWPNLWRRAFHQPVRRSDALFHTTPHAFELAAPAGVDISRIVRERLEHRGFRVQMAEVLPTDRPSEQLTDPPTICLRGDRNRLAPLATLVTHVAVLILLLGVVLSSVYGWREEIAIGPGETAEVGHGSGLMLRNEAFVVTRYPDGSASGYEARIAVLEGGRGMKRGSVRVNQPLTHGAVGLTLRGYQGTEGQYTLTLLAARDPGYAWVVVAGFLLLLGLTVSFNFPHCRVHVRVEPEGVLRVGGRADRRACDFEREFVVLAAELERAIEG